MTLYLDTSVIVPLFVTDPLNSSAEALLGTTRPLIEISDFAAAEFSSVVAARVRARQLKFSEARAAFAEFDAWVERKAETVELGRADLSAATNLVRRLDLPLRTGDAVHIAIVQRTGATLATFDRQMARAARRLGLSVVTK